jgi:hypothetical protein
MLDRVLEYLRLAGAPVPAERVLREALAIEAPNRATADRVLRGLTGPDARFAHNNGLWSTHEPPRGGAAASGLRAAFLHIESPHHRGVPFQFRGALFFGPDGNTLSFGANERELREARTRASGCSLVVWTQAQLRLWNRALLGFGLTVWEGDRLGLRILAQRTGVTLRAGNTPSDLCGMLGLNPPDADSPAEVAAAMHECFEVLKDRIPESFRRNADSINRWIRETAVKVDFSRYAFGPEFLATAPEAPGVYIMRNRAGHVLYVGKSANLRRRLGSYFTPRALETPKVARIHRHLYSMDLCPTPNEVDALILEMQLIRDFRPTINLQAEVHEGPATYGRVRNLILLIPTEENVQLYLLRDGDFLTQIRAPLGRPPSRALRSRIRAAFFGRRKHRRTREPWEAELISRWLSAHRRDINFLDVDETGGFESVILRLRDYLTDPDRLMRKVLYR